MLFSHPSAVAKATLPSFAISQSSRPVILDAACARLRQIPRTTSASQVRHASHGTAGRANGPKNGPGKRLGAKKTGDEYVIPGNILFRQRGTLWHPGENVGMGRDHTIFALQAGYVKYYRNPRLDPDKRYIGVAFEKTQTLPTPPNAARRRRLGMVAVARGDLVEGGAGAGVMGLGGDADADAGKGFGEAQKVGLFDPAAISSSQQIAVAQAPSSSSTSSTTPPLTRAALRAAKLRAASGRADPSTLKMTTGNTYTFRESNFSIGRAAERAGVQVKEFEKGDRFLAWRKKGVRKARNAERRSLGSKKGSGRKGRQGN